MTSSDFTSLGWPHPDRCAATFAQLVAKFADGGAPHFDAFAELRAKAAAAIRPARGVVVPKETQRMLDAIDRAPNPFAGEEVMRATRGGLL